MKILVVDDSRAMRGIILRTLRAMGLQSHTFLEASNGREGLKAVHESRPELVISDMNMPEINGLEFLRELKNSNSHSRLGFVTSDGCSKLAAEAKEAGAAFVVIKPFTQAVFSQAIGPVVEGLGSGPLYDRGEGIAEGATVTKGQLDPSQIAKILSALTRKSVRAVSAPPSPLPPKLPQVIAEYLLDHDSVIACGICDMAFAARTGAAMTLIPPSVVDEALTARKLTETMYDNFREVLNVVSQLFIAGKAGVSLGKVYLPPQPLPAALVARLAKPATRLDVRVDIDTYGEGRLTLVTLP